MTLMELQQVSLRARFSAVSTTEECDLDEAVWEVNDQREEDCVKDALAYNAVGWVSASVSAFLSIDEPPSGDRVEVPLASMT